MADDVPDVRLGLSEPAPAPSGSGAVVLVRDEVLAQVRRHAAEDLDHELGGVLVGTASSCETGTVVYIEGAIAAEHTQSMRGSITFTHETWAQINAEREQSFPDKRIIGWYHTHPGFGVFLSEYDLFIHRNFFSLPWQVALVLDPRAETSGVFVWQAGEIVGPAGLQIVHTTAQSPPPRPFTASAPRSGGGPWLTVVVCALLALLAMQTVELMRPQRPVADTETLAAIRTVGGQVTDLRDTLAPIVERDVEPALQHEAEVHITRASDTLHTIARDRYGDEDKWGALAVANGLTGAEVRPGTRLLIPGRLTEKESGRDGLPPAAPASR